MSVLLARAEMFSIYWRHLEVGHRYCDTVCLFNIRNIELQTLHLNMFMVLFKSLQSHDQCMIQEWGKAPGYVTIQTESFRDYRGYKLNYPLKSHCLFTLSLHWQQTSKAQNCNQSCTEVRAICKHRWQQLHTTTLLERTWPLFLHVWWTSNEIYQMKALLDCNKRTS